MGLDCYVMKKSATDNEPVEIWYGRKESEIHGWMQRESGIPAEEFNCEDLVLTEEVLNRFEGDAAAGLVSVSGYFFGAGNSAEEVADGVFRIVEVSRKALADGCEVRYTSWW